MASAAAAAAGESGSHRSDVRLAAGRKIEAELCQKGFRSLLESGLQLF